MPRSDAVNRRTSGDCENRLRDYEALVAEWGRRLDLVASGDLGRFRERHVDDCLRLLPLCDATGTGAAVDVGSGAGLPGIVLAIARPGRLWRLLEPRRKRAAFLEEAVRQLELDSVEVVGKSAEEAASDPSLAGAHVLAVARALAPPARTLRLLVPLLNPGGIAAVFVGKTGTIPPGAKEWGPGIAVVSTDMGAGHTSHT